jgi:predicted phosphodiesterase
MRIQLYSDLHLETEAFEPRPMPGAELLVLAGDIDAGWEGYAQFAGWPVPVIVVAGNHEFDGRELRSAQPALRARCAALGLRLLQREQLVLPAADGRRIRVLGATRWSDFALFGESGRARAERAAAYFQRLMGATVDGRPFDPAAVRAEGLACRDWLARTLADPCEGRWDATLVITHFAPSLRSADPRYGRQPGTASFCNADDDLLPLADLWLHGHLHCRHDYGVERPGRAATRVVCNARGHVGQGEADGWVDRTDLRI